MKSTILIGSGHPQSRCYKLGKWVYDQLEGDKALYDLSGYLIGDCLGCEYCLPHQGQCILEDQMQELYERFYTSDFLIFISPVYFSNIPATLKRVIDRCQLFFNLKDKSQVKKKDFLAIHIGGAPSYPGQFEAFYQSYKVLLPDLRASLKDLIEVTSTDRVDFLEDHDLKARIKKDIDDIAKKPKEERNG